MNSPVDGTTYNGQITNYAYDTIISFMLIFSGLDRNDNIVIFDYILGTIDSESNPIYEFSYTYNLPSEAVIEDYDSLDFDIASIDGSTMRTII